jgi:thiamine monophosphate kinase
VPGDGDDYESCFTVSPQRVALLPDATAAGVSWTRIGVVCAGEGIELRRDDTVMQFSAAAFDHFGI